MKTLICVLLCAISMTAAADIVSFSAVANVRVGNKVVQAGDRAAQVRKVREPDSVTDITNKYGAKVGEQWLYDRGNGSYTVILVNNYGMVYDVGDFISR